MTKKDIKTQINNSLSEVKSKDPESGFYSKLFSGIKIENNSFKKFSYYLINGKIFENLIKTNILEKCYELDQYYGSEDKRLGLAQIRHDLSSNQDKYTLKCRCNIIDYKINYGFRYKDVASYLDYKIRTLGYSSKDIEFIEGLLFLKDIMSEEDEDKQILFYTLALERLNNIYD